MYEILLKKPAQLYLSADENEKKFFRRDEIIS